VLAVTVETTESRAWLNKRVKIHFNYRPRWDVTTSAVAMPRYRAFLSYSHKDKSWANWLHRALESYHVDRDLVGRKTPAGEIPQTLRPIFRDRDDFAGGPSLKEATLRAIEASDFLVVICSPNAASSRYVNEEVRLFKARGGSERVISVIVDGEPNDATRECFPPALRFIVEQDGQITSKIDEPIAADARPEADGRDLARDKVVAGLLGLTLDEIRKRAIRAHRRRLIALTSVSVLMAALALAASIAAWIARQRTIEAEQRLDLALETAGSLTTKTTTFKGKFGVPIPILTDLLHGVDQLLGRLEQEGVKSSKLEFREAKLLEALSDSNTDLGNTPKALEEAQQAADKLKSLTGSSRTGQSEQRSSNSALTGYLFNQIQRAKVQLRSIIMGISPLQEDYNSIQNELGWAYLKTGDLLSQQSKLADAKTKYLDARQILRNWQSRIRGT
jgi:hypothetical protein